MNSFYLKIPAYSKLLGLLLIAIGIPIMLVDESAAARLPLLVGLFTILVTGSKTEDERAVQLKNNSLYLAFIISYAIKLLTSNLHGHNLISFELSDADHLLMLVLALANVMYFARLYLNRL